MMHDSIRDENAVSGANASEGPASEDVAGETIPIDSAVGRRRTWQRDAVREALGSQDGFVSAQVLHAGLREAGSPIGLATVYRALADLAADGAADHLQHDGESLYRACGDRGHHHHLICRSCGRTVEISADPVEAWARSVAADNGFRDAEHVVDVFGICANC